MSPQQRNSHPLRQLVGLPVPITHLTERPARVVQHVFVVVGASKKVALEALARHASCILASSHPAKMLQAEAIDSGQSQIDQLETAGITTGDYNLPDWEENREGLGRLIDELFRFSPPTAILFQEAPLFKARLVASCGSRYHRSKRYLTSCGGPRSEFCLEQTYPL